jgi:hypothetical protein
VASIHTLVEPKEFPKDLIEACKYKLKKGTKTQNWLNATGGIDGQTFGLEADVLGGKRIEQAFEKVARPYLKTPQEILAKERDGLFKDLRSGIGRKTKDVECLPSFEELAFILMKLSAQEIKKVRKLVQNYDENRHSTS